ncbi:hypothetical protein Cgig2_030668 [Carnegiea gigantea]|uniref:Aminotransferase-like plant mobile domain-containing protein n=1 Tax=Carnegiea gigantea TaxID=171969 RepID=A0A9Q1JSM7_9CARY|nr:hypothetical protein Cgig2_030668 [Carnegiea gigantea]
MGEGSCSGQRRTKTTEVFEEVEVEDTSSGSDYMAESSESGGSSGGSESLECVPVGRSRKRHGKRMSVVPKLKSMWRSFEEVKLLDSSGSDFDGRDEGNYDSSPIVSLVDKSELESEAEMKSGEVGMRKKGVPRQDRRQRKKVIGDGGVLGGHPLKGAKGKCVSIRGRCILECIVSMNDRLSDYQREALMGTVLKPILKYHPFAIERNLAPALVKCWVPRSKAFRLADKLVPFSVFDVALLTGLPTTREKVEFLDDNCTTEIVNMELRRRKVGKDSKDSRVYKNFIGAIVYLCEQNAREEQLDLWLKLFTWLILSGLMFPCSVYGAAWELQRYANDVQGMSRYAWAEAVLRYLVQCLDDMQRRLCNPYTTRYEVYEKRTFPRIGSWAKVYHGGRYDAVELVAEIEEHEVRKHCQLCVCILL